MSSRLFFLGLMVLSFGMASRADDTFLPTDPIAAVDGQPVSMGELNLVLAERLGIEKSRQAAIQIQQATALMLVRRHLAMKTLMKSGGNKIATIIARRIESTGNELGRRNSSLAEFAKSRMADEESLRTDLAWKIAWGEYIKTRLTEKNLRRFFAKQPGRYGAANFEDLTDHGRLRRDATNALFQTLVRRQQHANIQWFVPALRPPADVPVIPSAFER